MFRVYQDELCSWYTYTQWSGYNISDFSLSLTPQKGRVHENLPINLMEDRPMDTAIHENIHHNIATSKPTLTEKFSLNTDGNIFTESPPKNVHIEISTTGNQVIEWFLVILWWQLKQSFNKHLIYVTYSIHLQTISFNLQIEIDWLTYNRK